VTSTLNPINSTLIATALVWVPKDEPLQRRRPLPDVRGYTREAREVFARTSSPPDVTATMEPLAKAF
jgi:hypothetical protein